MQKLRFPLFFLVAVIIGFVIGRLIPSEPTANEAHAPGSPSTGQDQSSKTGRTSAGATAEAGSTIEAASDPVKNLSLEQKMAQIDQLKLTASLENSIQTLELIASMSEPELQGLLESMGQRGMSSMSDWMMPYYVFTAWVGKNPQNAYQYLQSEANPMQQQMYGHTLFSAWAATDADGALAAVEQINDKQKQEQAYGAIAMAIAGKDPNRAYNLLASREETNAYQYHMIFMLWAGKDLDGAMAKVNSMEIGDERRHALSGMIGGMASKDINRAAEFATSLERDEEREQALQTIMHTWINQDIDGAVEFISQVEDVETKNNILESAMWALARSDPEKAMEVAQSQMSGQAQDRAVSNVIRQIAREDPVKAAELASDLPYGRVYSNSVQAVANEWGDREPMAALQWAETLTAGEEKEDAMNSILRSFADKEPEEAKVYLTQMPEGENRSKMAGYIADKMARNEPREALVWAKSLSADLAGDATQTAISTWASKDPRAVVDYLQTTGGTKELNASAGTIAYNWARRDLETAADWSLGLEGDAQEEAVERVSREWLDHNTEEASIWIANLDAGPARDQAVQNLVSKVYRSDPEAAFAWAKTISDERNRYYSAQRAIRELSEDGKADQARSLIEKSELSDEEKEKLARTID